MTTPDIRAALERLVELDDGKGPTPAIATAWTDAIAAARAALAEPVGEGPSAAELMSLSAACNSPSVFARAILARWGRPAAPPAPEPGEVAELVRRLRDWHSIPLLQERERIATLLSQQAAPAPVVVPVAIPGEQWHEDDGACLWWRFPIEEPPWSGDPREDDWPGHHTHFTRIVCPLPQAGEGQP